MRYYRDVFVKDIPGKMIQLIQISRCQSVGTIVKFDGFACMMNIYFSLWTGLLYLYRLVGLYLFCL